MNTRCLPATEDTLALAARLIREGQVVAFPTETVYGLGANALLDTAVRAIFAAKERPADNPLIVHIARVADMTALCHVNARARRLARAFWPGPLTMILPKKAVVPGIVTAGLDSVAIRMPAHPTARALIRLAGVPIAAPSANRSGKPSPTRAGHVLDDMAGRIPLIVDGGACDVGVESTVVSLTGDVATILRPGGVTPDRIAAVLGDVRVADSVMRPLRDNESAPSPGMRHTHYAPSARMTLFVGAPAAVTARIRAEYDVCAAGGEAPLILCASQSLPDYGARAAYDLGPDAQTAAQRLFAALRQADAAHITRVLSEGYPQTGVGLAVMNRMARAAGFDIIQLR